MVIYIFNIFIYIYTYPKFNVNIKIRMYIYIYIDIYMYAYIYICPCYLAEAGAIEGGARRDSVRERRAGCRQRARECKVLVLQPPRLSYGERRFRNGGGFRVNARPTACAISRGSSGKHVFTQSFGTWNCSGRMCPAMLAETRPEDVSVTCAAWRAECHVGAS